MSKPPDTIIGPRIALLLYAALIAISFLILHGKALAFGLIIVIGVAVKSFVGYLRQKASEKDDQ